MISKILAYTYLKENFFWNTTLFAKFSISLKEPKRQDYIVIK